MTDSGAFAPRGRVLSIAGSDSGAGAGIQADIKAVAAIGGYATTAITAITVQNTMGVRDIHEIPVPIIQGQIAAVLEDIGADAIKTGMLGTSAVIEAVAATLAQTAPGVPIVADPVMVAKGGARLLDAGAEAALKERLLPLASLVTPNCPEAEVLTGQTITSREDMERAGQALLALGPRAVLVKGGHLDANAGGSVYDLLLTHEDMRWFHHPRLPSRHTHGTGCTLASAIAALLARGVDLTPAVEQARAYVREAIRQAPGLGQGQGPLEHMCELRPGKA